MTLIQFTRNHTDLSTDKGYQFEFFCDRCGNGFMSEFQASAVGIAGRALRAAGGFSTYFFRLLDPPDAAVLQDTARAAAAVEHGIDIVTRALGLLSYRRRPIYLSDDELTGDPAFHRYAFAARKMPEVRYLRAAFLGRAMHGSLDAWRVQVTDILAPVANDRDSNGMSGLARAPIDRAGKTHLTML